MPRPLGGRMLAGWWDQAWEHVLCVCACPCLLTDFNRILSTDFVFCFCLFHSSVACDYLCLATYPSLCLCRPPSLPLRFQYLCLLSKSWIKLNARGLDDVRNWNSITAVCLTLNMLFHKLLQCTPLIALVSVAGFTSPLKTCIGHANTDIMQAADEGSALLLCLLCLVLTMEIFICQSVIWLVIIPLLTQATRCFGVNSQEWEPEHRINSYTSIYCESKWHSLKEGHTNSCYDSYYTISKNSELIMELFPVE